MYFSIPLFLPMWTVAVSQPQELHQHSGLDATLSSHKVARVKPGIEAAGATLRYLPPYSPDFNPIEQVFAKLKTLLRNTQARALETLWSAIGSLLGQFKADECERYIRHWGCIFGGSGEIRTHGGLTSSAVFKTAAFNRSATLPSRLV